GLRHLQARRHRTGRRAPRRAHRSRARIARHRDGAATRRSRTGADQGVLMTSMMSGVASPVDFETYGDYAPPPGAYVQRGDIATLTYPIDDRVTDDGSSGFPAAAGRYHLYYSLYCPWAQRPLI